ncbi:hypothetical protein [Pyrococcus abyssi]|uniref:Uncharacterized protein n=1 Tax=Pyrococcus abyssi (strain GE5 / Orsay) TaxID=272844 RepID=Q9UY45_PYRAB|nr:hypothetical protein [Pyrococcus abyssi]CAB50567.1 Hypothetical protein PAB1090 [Pyrococcus abyssi GE5]
MEWKEKFKREGFLDVGDFIIELIYVDCPCEPLPPMLAIYDKKEDEWYRVDERVEANNYTEAFEWACSVIERIIRGDNVSLVSIDGPAPDPVLKRLRENLSKLTS